EHARPARSPPERDGEPLVGGDDLGQPGGLGGPLGVGQQVVERVVVVGRVVVEQGEAPGAGLVGDEHGVVHRAVAPVVLLRELLDRVLGVVDDEVGAVAQLEDVVAHPVAAVVGHLVVGDVGHRRPADLDPVAVVGPDVRHRAHPDLRPVDLDVAVVDVVELDLAVELLDRHREERRAHELAEGVGQGADLLRGPVDVELGAGRQDRAEVRQALHMVAVRVGDQRGAPEAAVGRQRLAQPAEPGAEVEDDRVVARCVELHARGVPAVPAVLVAGTRGRAPDTEEGDVQQGTPSAHVRSGDVTQPRRSAAPPVTTITAAPPWGRGRHSRLGSPPMTEPSHEIQQGAVEANGLRFAYLAAGAPGAPLALCLHGFPDSAWTWRHLLPALAAAGFRAVAPWMRGYAPTEVPADGHYQTAVLGLDACALHEALGGGDDAVLVGHDWGALAGYAAAHHAGTPWRRLVALA